MARISSVVFSLCIAACALAAPMHRRQIGDLDCNLARLKVVSDTGCCSDLGRPNQHNRAQWALHKAGLNSINSAIEDILTAVFANQTSPADSRDQLEQGLNTANSALLLIKDPSANATVSAARAKLLAAGAAGDQVLSGCK
ncbi:hypothetical protein B0H16DRAFT_1458739 [Mycena metata]|uniref:Pectinesterase inhibitor domain-containing protein n=1 Tax=Mycena metata TaxID=1033252 RepID=A0AAD7NBT4_9AGAR|nr:hypothetical protein B0H16DRAFT_1458739 [Mycena metata]